MSAAPGAKAIPSVRFTRLFIDNEFVDALSGRTFASVNPATEAEICQVAEADKADVDRAVRAAQRAFARGSPWRTMDASQRGQLLYELAAVMKRERDYLAALDTLDNGETAQTFLAVPRI